jgi:hypothetical protein
VLKTLQLWPSWQLGELTTLVSKLIMVFKIQRAPGSHLICSPAPSAPLVPALQLWEF